MMRRAVYPGSFNPPTIAHLAIAETALAARRLDRVDLTVSRRALNKEHVDRPRLEHRVAVLEAVAASRPWLAVAVTDAQLLADIARGYDVVIMGADKWAQVHDLRYYGGSATARDAAVEALPEVVLVPRPPHPLPDGLGLPVPPALADVSSSAARAGRRELMAPEAAAFDVLSGAWTDPPRYERWLRSGAVR